MVVGSLFSILCKLKSNQQIPFLRKGTARTVASVFAGFTYYNRNVLQGTIQYLQGNEPDDLIQLFHFWLLRTAQADPSSQRDFCPTILNEENFKTRFGAFFFFFFVSFQYCESQNSKPYAIICNHTKNTMKKHLIIHKTEYQYKSRKLILYVNLLSNLEHFTP